MRNLIVLVLLPAVLAQGCATAATPHPASSTPPATAAGGAIVADPAKLSEINDELAGEPATIELAGGEVVRQAQSVRLGSEVTSWHDSSGRERTVPTAEVRRVLSEERHLGRGFGYGAAAAVLPGYLVFNSGNCRTCSGYSAEGAFVAGVLVVVAGGLIGMVVATAKRHPVVVYTGPQPPRAADARPAPAELHCRLAPAAAGDRLECAPLPR
jgi:hypothetical protein